MNPHHHYCPEEYLNRAIEHLKYYGLKNAVSRNFLGLKADHIIGGNVDNIHAAHANYNLKQHQFVVLSFCSVVPDTVPKFSGILQLTV